LTTHQKVLTLHRSFEHNIVLLFKNQRKMKKVVLSLAVLFAAAMVSCNNAKTEENAEAEAPVENTEEVAPEVEAPAEEAPAAEATEAPAEAPAETPAEAPAETPAK
jgi:peptidoglycan hydrolase CwlO-like protein